MSNFQKKVLGNIWAIDCSPDQRESLKTILTALDISTGPLARRTFQTAGPVRARTFYLSLARTGHLDICRATRFQIVLARTMTIHSMYFSRGHPSHILAVFAQPFCYSETPACRESESGMSIKHTDVSV